MNSNVYVFFGHQFNSGRDIYKNFDGKYKNNDSIVLSQLKNNTVKKKLCSNV